MRLWVKICGNTSLVDAQLAADAGADAVGFVFANSPRQVTVEQVAAITPYLPPEIEKIGVFVDWNFPAIAAAVKDGGLTGVQLHSESEAEISGQLRGRFGPKLKILQVLHFGSDVAGQLRAASVDPNIDAVLIDSRTATAVGGTGIPFDWQAASETIFSGNGSTKLIAAGGLNPSNVAEAIALLKPWGVDVASGVEAAPGRKDPAKVADFVANARSAAESGSLA
jgi:phosphoribosylanthranilate isomerase